jgi:hypothetical protein
VTVYLEGTEITDLRLMLNLAASPDYDLERLLLSAADYETVQAEYAAHLYADARTGGWMLDYTIPTEWPSRLAPVPVTTTPWEGVTVAHTGLPMIRIRAGARTIDIALIYLIVNPGWSFARLWNLVILMLQEGAETAFAITGFQKFVRKEGFPQTLEMSIRIDGVEFDEETNFDRYLMDEVV